MSDTYVCYVSKQKCEVHASLTIACLFSRPNVILGVTNPFFIKTFQSWPHIIRLSELKMAGIFHLTLTLKNKIKIV